MKSQVPLRFTPGVNTHAESLVPAVVWPLCSAYTCMLCQNGSTSPHHHGDQDGEAEALYEVTCALNGRRVYCVCWVRCARMGPRKTILWDRGWVSSLAVHQPTYLACVSVVLW